jgi:hypothetical protein
VPEAVPDVIVEVVLEVADVDPEVEAEAEVPDVEDVSDPIGAKGFGLPSVPSGVRVMLESIKEVNAGSANIASFSLIFLTFKRSDKNSLPTGVLLIVNVPDSPGTAAEVVTKLGSCLLSPFMKKK